LTFHKLYGRITSKKTKESEVLKMDNNNDFEILEDGAEGIEVIDLDGEPFAVIGELEYEGELYFALVPYDENEEEDEDEELEFVILREAEENGEHYLATIDDDSFYEKIGEMFLKLFAESGDE